MGIETLLIRCKEVFYGVTNCALRLLRWRGFFLVFIVREARFLTVDVRKDRIHTRLRESGRSVAVDPLVRHCVSRGFYLPC